MIGQICEAFNCTPLEAIAQPLPLCLDIIEERAFAQAYYAVKDSKDGKVPSTPMTRLVQQMAEEASMARKAGEPVPIGSGRLARLRATARSRAAEAGSVGTTSGP